MAVFNIKNMKVIAPSPDNFIIRLGLTDNVAGHEDISCNFIASGEQVYQEKNKVALDLIRNHVAHSSVFKVGNRNITAFSLFDLNDVGITTHDMYDSKLNYDAKTRDNLLLMPNANVEPQDKDEYDIPMHVINSNAVYGYVKTTNKSFGFPGYKSTDKDGQKFNMTTHNASSPSAGTTDTLTLYKYTKSATSVSNVLRLGNQCDISANQYGFDKLFVFDPTDDNRIAFDRNMTTWRDYQTNFSIDSRHVTNNFDDGTLIVRSIIFPKQTLNNEYSTERKYVKTSTAPYNYVRKYAWDDTYFYSSGTQIVLNHREDNTFASMDKPKYNDSGTMVTSTYSNRFGDMDKLVHDHTFPIPPSSVVKTDYNKYIEFGIGKSPIMQNNIGAKKGVFSQYTPEIFNRSNETQSDTALLTSVHKANIFDIEFKDVWNKISEQLTVNDHNQQAYKEIKDNLKSSIKTNLFKLVEEIKPAHTALYKIQMDDGEEVAESSTAL